MGIHAEKIKFFLISALFLAAFSSCRKDPPFPVASPTACPCCSVQENSPSTIITGDTTGMHVYPASLLFEYTSYGHDTLNIDIDSNNINDFQIIGFKFTQTGGSTYRSENKIFSLDDSSLIGGILQGDTMYYAFTSEYVGGGFYMQRFDTISYSCSKFTCCDDIHQISDKVNLFYPGDIISKDQDWVTSGHVERAPYLLDHYFPVVNDSIVIQTTRYITTCNNMTNSLPVYISFKKTICGREKMGWLKFIEGASTPWPNLILSEIAIQK
jgi:hypothetical protein